MMAWYEVNDLQKPDRSWLSVERQLQGRRDSVESMDGGRGPRTRLGLESNLRMADSTAAVWRSVRTFLHSPSILGAGNLIVNEEWPD